jgi:hypothetical protein
MALAFRAASHDGVGPLLMRRLTAAYMPLCGANSAVRDVVSEAERLIAIAQHEPWASAIRKPQSQSTKREAAMDIIILAPTTRPTKP